MSRRMRYQDDMEPMFDTLVDLNLQQRTAIKSRYRFLMAEYRRRCRIYAVLFYILRITMNVGSIAVPALMSLSVPPGSEGLLKWFTWSVSVGVSIAHGLTTLFKLDKRFFMLHAIAERLRTETWQYLELTGRYSGHWGGQCPTHANQYMLYTSQMEKIRMKHIDEEFVRGADMVQEQRNHQAQQRPSPTDSIAISVPSPADQAIQVRRRVSSSTVGTSHEEEHSTSEQDTLQVQEPGRQSVSEISERRDIVLPPTPPVPAQSSLHLRTPVQSGTLQQQPASTGDA
jgi:hypothetical protein